MATIMYYDYDSCNYQKVAIESFVKYFTNLISTTSWPQGMDVRVTFWNHIHALATWFCAMATKVCNILSSLYLGWATMTLAHQDYHGMVKYAELVWFHLSRHDF